MALTFVPMDKTLDEMLVFKMDGELLEGLYGGKGGDAVSLGSAMNFSFNTQGAKA